MGFKFKSLHISAFAVIVAILLGLAYMLNGSSKEGFENAKTIIVTKEYMSPNKQRENVKQFFKKYGVAPYTDIYNASNLLDIDTKTYSAFVNKYGADGGLNWKDEAGQMLASNQSVGKFIKKIGFESGPGLKYEMAKKIFSQLTAKSGSSSNNNSESSQLPISMAMTNNSGAGQDNYNHFDGTSIPTMFYGPNGSIAKISNQGGVFSVIVSDKDGTNVVYDEQNKSLLSQSSLAAIDTILDKIVSAIARSSQKQQQQQHTHNPVMKYYGPNGAVALMYMDSNSNMNLKLIDGTGREISYNSTNMQSYNPSVDNPNVPQTMGGPNSPNKMNVSSNYQEAYSQSLTGPDYSSSLPKGIPKDMIPAGNEDLYILKSEVVPPVCPACPQPILKCGDDKPPPPCPPCARCPEPRFDCKKVPNYGSGNLGANYFGGGGQFGSMPSTSGNFLPFPSVSNYSTFGN
jgi:hypothetical protein